MEEFFLSFGWDTGRVQDFVDTLRLGSDQHVVSPGGVMAIVLQFGEQGGITADTLLEDLGISQGKTLSCAGVLGGVCWSCAWGHLCRTRRITVEGAAHKVSVLLLSDSGPIKTINILAIVDRVDHAPSDCFERV